MAAASRKFVVYDNNENMKNEDVPPTDLYSKQDGALDQNSSVLQSIATSALPTIPNYRIKKCVGADAKKYDVEIVSVEAAAKLSQEKQLVVFAMTGKHFRIDVRQEFEKLP